MKKPSGSLGISPEWQAHLNISPPYLLYGKELNLLECKLSCLPGEEVDFKSPLMLDGKWSQIDLYTNWQNRDEVIGFSLLHLGHATYFLPRLLVTYQTEDLSLYQVVEGVTKICKDIGQNKDIFGRYKDFFMGHELAHKLKLSTFSLQDEADPSSEMVLKIVTRELLVKLGVRLLS